MTPAYERAREIAQHVKALRENPVFTEFSDALGSMLTAETNAHEDEKRTPHERAEHLFSMKLLRELSKWLDTREATNAKNLRPAP